MHSCHYSPIYFFVFDLGDCINDTRTADCELFDTEHIEYQIAKYY